MRIAVKELAKLLEAKEKCYQLIHDLTREFHNANRKMETEELSPRKEAELVEKLSNIMKALIKEDIRVKSFWERVRERFNIFYPWQIDCLVEYAESLKLGESDSIGFKF